jgi:hypothetical protein
VLATVFLGIIAIALLVQTGYLVYLGMAGRKAVRRLEALELAFRRDVRPALESLRRVSENVELVSARVLAGMPQIEVAMQEAAHNARRAGQAIAVFESLVLTALRPLARGLALFKGIRRGFDTFRDAPRLSAGRRS